MAAGSHAENGIWALLVIAPEKYKIRKVVVIIILFSRLRFHDGLLRIKINLNKRNESPIRFVKRVTNPEKFDLFDV
jgi:hypothetical protein